MRPIPSGFRVTRSARASAASYRDGAHEGRSLEIELRWFRPVHVGLLAFCVVWDALLVGWYAIVSVLAHRGTLSPPWNLLVFFFPLAHLVVAVGSSYTALATVFNRSRLLVTGAGAVLTHGPWPWPGGASMSLADVRISVEPYRGFPDRPPATRRWSVVCELSDGSKRTLWRGFERADDALFVASHGDDQQGWILKATVAANRAANLQPFIEIGRAHV